MLSSLTSSTVALQDFFDLWGCEDVADFVRFMLGAVFEGSMLAICESGVDKKWIIVVEELGLTSSFGITPSDPSNLDSEDDSSAGPEVKKSLSLLSPLPASGVVLVCFHLCLHIRCGFDCFFCWLSSSSPSSLINVAMFLPWFACLGAMSYN